MEQLCEENVLGKAVWKPVFRNIGKYDVKTNYENMSEERKVNKSCFFYVVLGYRVKGFMPSFFFPV